MIIMFNKGHLKLFFIVSAFLGSSLYSYLQAQQENKIIAVKKIKSLSDFSFDGILDDTVWSSAPKATYFIQRFPKDGEKASEQTEAMVLLTKSHIIIGVNAYDSSPDSITSSLFRRDSDGNSDWFYVMLDSYNDNQTAYVFGFNPQSVQRDILLFNDSNQDVRWNAVWDVHTSRSEQGWHAEVRIPLNQLRFNLKEGEQDWGINFRRVIARKEEESFWAQTPLSQSNIVSNFGILSGISGIRYKGTIEVVPYLSGRALLSGESDPDPNDPYFNQLEPFYMVGSDIKWQPSPGISISSTINPDFGQVEADPAQVNLSAFELFFPERRSFFIEGIDIFRFGSTTNFNNYGLPLPLYTRRIGKAPYGNVSDAGVDGDLVFENKNDQLTILNANKINGKIEDWSFGFLNAITLPAKASYQIFEEQSDESHKQIEKGRIEIEPLTSYTVSRIKRNFRGGKSTVGGYFSNVYRFFNERGYIDTELSRSAYLVGLDFEQTWINKTWVFSGVGSFSSLSGESSAITLIQEQSSRYFNRPDAKSFQLDEERTQLSGHAFELSFGKFVGKLKGSITYTEVTPGYEVNDLGFMNRADYRAFAWGLNRRLSLPFTRYSEFWLEGGYQWNFDGDILDHAYRGGGSLQFHNLWRANFVFKLSGNSYRDRLTRGGPIAKRPRDWWVWFRVRTNQNKKISFSGGGFIRQDQSGEYDYNIRSGILLLPKSNIQVSLNMRLSYEYNTDQYVDVISDDLKIDTFGERYIFSNVKQVSFSLPIRLDWSFNAQTTLQFYARPYLNQGRYTDYKEFDKPRTNNYIVYGLDNESTIISFNDTEYSIDPDGPGEASSFTIENNNFNYQALQANMIFRWEFKPGSQLFFIWQLNQDNYLEAEHSASSRFSLFNDFGTLFQSELQHTFLVKLNYRLVL